MTLLAFQTCHCCCNFAWLHSLLPFNLLSTWEICEVINEVRSEDFLFEDVDFIKEENECFLFEKGVILDLSKHLQSLHQLVLLSLKNEARLILSL